MNEGCQVLINRFSGEIADLEMLCKRLQRAWRLAVTSAYDQDIFLDATALNLHGFYAGIESLFLLVAKHLDRNVPQGEQWHRELFRQMESETAKRPAVIDKDDALFLDELRRFRHLVRNVYAFNLIPERIEPLVSTVQQKWPKLKTELLAFAEFLQEMAVAEQILIAEKLKSNHPVT